MPQQADHGIYKSDVSPLVTSRLCFLYHASSERQGIRISQQASTPDYFLRLSHLAYPVQPRCLYWTLRSSSYLDHNIIDYFAPAITTFDQIFTTSHHLLSSTTPAIELLLFKKHYLSSVIMFVCLLSYLCRYQTSGSTPHPRSCSRRPCDRGSQPDHLLKTMAIAA